MTDKARKFTERELVVLFSRIALEKGIFKNPKERAEKIAIMLGDKASFTAKGYEILLELYDQLFQINEKIENHFKSKHYIEKD